MDLAKPGEVTELLKEWRGGDASALERLTALVHTELHQIARRYLRNERPGQSLQATALVNEAYLRLVDISGVEWRARAQFFVIAAQIMRNILVDAARARCSEKRGGGMVRIDLEKAPLVSAEPEAYLVALNDTLEAFAAIAPRQAKVVELRYFGGLTEEETAEVLQTTSRTVRRDWQFAKAWLQNELNGSTGG